MKATFHVSDLRKAMAFLSKAVSNNQAHLVLSNVCCILEGKMLYMKATDLSTTLVINIPAVSLETPDTDPFLIPTTSFNALLSALPKDQLLVIESSNLRVNFNWGGNVQTIATESATLFPARERVKKVIQHELIPEQAIKFLSGLLACANNCSTNEFMPAFRGVNINATEEGTYLTGTDSFSVTEVYLGSLLPYSVNLTILKAFVNVLGKVLNDIGSDQNLTLIESDGKLSFKLYPYYLVAERINLPYPPVTSMIRTVVHESNAVLVDRDSLLQAVKLACLTVHDTYEHVTLTIYSGGLSVNSQRSTATTTLEKIPISTQPPYTIDGPVSINLNGKRFLSMVQALAPGELTLGFSGAMKPIYLAGEDKSILSVLAPVHVP